MKQNAHHAHSTQGGAERRFFCSLWLLGLLSAGGMVWRGGLLRANTRPTRAALFLSA
jgi:hypothetical protein